jgi:hypothetical protein
MVNSGAGRCEEPFDSRGILGEPDISLICGESSILRRKDLKCSLEKVHFEICRKRPIKAFLFDKSFGSNAASADTPWRLAKDAAYRKSAAGTPNPARKEISNGSDRGVAFSSSELQRKRGFEAAEIASGISERRGLGERSSSRLCGKFRADLSNQWRLMQFLTHNNSTPK